MELSEAEKKFAAELAAVLSGDLRELENKPESTGLSPTVLTVLKNRIENSADLYPEEVRLEPKGLSDIIKNPEFLDAVMGQSFMPENADKVAVEDRLGKYAAFIDEAIGQDPEDLNVGVAWAEKQIHDVTPPPRTGREAVAEVNRIWEEAVKGFVADTLKP